MSWFALTLLTISPLCADTGPYGPTHQVLSGEQSGQQVELQLRVLSLSVGALLRNEQPVFDSWSWEESEASAHEPGLCYSNAEWADCEEYPDSCQDCDGDGVRECNDTCYETWDVLWTDPCVPPGSANYSFYDTTLMDYPWYGMTVDDVGQDCDSTHDSGSPQGDTGEASGTDPQQGCGCSLPIPALRDALLVALMLSTGIVLRRRPR